MNNEEMKKAKCLTWKEFASYIERNVFHAKDYTIVPTDNGVAIQPKEKNHDTIYCVSWFTRIGDALNINSYVTIEDGKMTLIFHA